MAFSFGNNNTSFGGTATQTQPQQQQQPAAGTTPATSSLFGGGAAATPAPSFFGSQPAQPTPAPTFSFGAPAAQPQQQQQQQPAQQQQQTPTPAPAPNSFFGQSQSAASASLFAPKTFSLSSSTPQQPSASTSTAQAVPKLGAPYPPPDPNEPSIESRIEAIQASWDPANPKCRFQTYFYNDPTPPNTVASYKSPPPDRDDAPWRKAVRENPDPEHLVPALAIGFPSIQKRLDAQQAQSLAHQARLTEIHDYLTTLSSSHSLSTSLRTLRATQNAANLSSRLLTLVAKAAALSPSRNMSIRKEEDALRIGLEGMSGEVQRVGERGNDLWAGVGALKARKQGTGDGEREWQVVDEEGLNQVLEILASQQAGLDHLTKTLNAATHDVAVISEAFGLTTSTSKQNGTGTPSRGAPR